MQPVKRGFTMVELLVVIAIIAVLSAILFPVYAQVREKARGISCLSNMRQIGLAVSMYLQDNDEGLVLDTHSGPTSSWIETLQPYTKNRRLNRCPSDRSANLERPLAGQTAVRRASYAINNYLTPGGGFMTLAAIANPAQTIYVGELADNKTGDHFHVSLWPRIINPLTEVATKRHQEGANYVFVDGHTKWYRFEQTFNPPAVNWWDPGWNPHF